MQMFHYCKFVLDHCHRKVWKDLATHPFPLAPCCSGLCSQTFYGHMNSCNAAVFNLTGTMLASTDADGMLKLWDTRMVRVFTALPRAEMKREQNCRPCPTF
jgi:WD40 repeat protein